MTDLDKAREECCPYCGDGTESIGTLHHIECAAALTARVEELERERDNEMRLRKNAGAAAVLAIELKEQAEAALAAERERLRWMAAQRSSFHLTYHGGYHDADNLAAFQHGMDTVFNWLRDLAARPAPEEE